MKKTVFLVATLLTVLFLLTSCDSGFTDINIMVPCDRFSANNHLENDLQTKVGGISRIALCSNPTTGFQWEYSITDESVLKVVNHDFQEPEGDVLGEPGLEEWTFEAIGKGTTEVLMVYSRPWEGGEKEEWTYTLTVVVE